MEALSRFVERGVRRMGGDDFGAVNAFGSQCKVAEGMDIRNVRGGMLKDAHYAIRERERENKHTHRHRLSLNTPTDTQTKTLSLYLSLSTHTHTHTHIYIYRYTRIHTRIDTHTHTGRLSLPKEPIRFRRR